MIFEFLKPGRLIKTVLTNDQARERADRAVEGVRENEVYHIKGIAGRHGSPAAAAEGHHDYRRPLTEKGKAAAKAGSVSIDYPDMADIGFTGRDRTALTAKARIAGANDPVIVDKLMAKAAIDPRLNYYDQGPVEHWLGEVYLGKVTGKKYLRAIIEDSDRMAAENPGAIDRMSWNKVTAQVGSVFLDMMGQRVTDEQIQSFKKNREPIIDALRVSHGSVIEAFLAKIIVKIAKTDEEGAARLEQFINAVGAQGFDPLESISYDIVNATTDPQNARIIFGFWSNKKSARPEDSYVFNGQTYQKPAFDFSVELSIDDLRKIVNECGGYISKEGFPVTQGSPLPEEIGQ